MTEHEQIEALVDRMFEHPDDPLGVAERKGWEITNRGQAEWAMGRVAVANAEYTETLASIKAARERLAHYEEEARHTYEAKARYLEWCLRQWAEKQLAGEKSRTVKLAYGAVKARRVPGTVRIDDETALLAWINERPALRQKYPKLIKEEVRKSSLKAVIEATGELPPGVELVPEYDSWSVEVDDGTRRIEAAE